MRPPASDSSIAIRGHLTQLRKFSSRHTYERNRLIYRMDDPADSVYLLESGRVKVEIISPEGKEKIIVISHDVTGVKLKRWDQHAPGEGTRAGPSRSVCLFSYSVRATGCDRGRGAGDQVRRGPPVRHGGEGGWRASEEKWMVP